MKSKNKVEKTVSWWMLIGNEWIPSPDRSFFNKNKYRARAIEKRTSFYEGYVYKGTKCESIPLVKKHAQKTNKKVHYKRKKTKS